MSQAFARDGAPGGFESVDAVVGARADDGAACLGAEGDGDLFHDKDLRLEFVCLKGGEFMYMS